MKFPKVKVATIILLAFGGLTLAVAPLFALSDEPRHAIARTVVTTLGTLSLACAATGLVFYLSLISTQSMKREQTITRTSNNIAKTVGRMAPIVRNTEQTLLETKSSVKSISENVPSATAKPRGHGAHAHPGQNRALVAPKGHQSSIEEVAIILPNATNPDDGLLSEHRQVFLDKNAEPSATIPVTPSQPVTLDCDISDAASLTVALEVAPNLHVDPRAGMLTASVFDLNGKQIDFPTLASKSETHGYFAYLATDTTKAEQKQLINVQVPRHATKVRLTLRAWGRSIEVANKIGLTINTIDHSWLESRPAKHVKVAAILDEFSYNSFKFECDFTLLSPDSWRKQLDENTPDLFFCESVWSGHDSTARPWKGRVYASSAFDYENRTALLEILQYCNERNIPTVFWNKEDPSHYDDKKHNFVDTAIRFDHVFTTDADSVERYRLEHGHPSVHCLPFAVQPRLFNPIQPHTPRSEAVVFAGGWYENHKKRCRDMATMFDTVLASDRELVIYDRYLNSNDGTHTFPEKYSTHLKPPVDHTEIAGVYKESNIGMTINTETRSRTMFARRIFELMACNTLVVSNYSTGVDDFFGEGVVFLDRDADRFKNLTDEEARRLRKANLTNVLSNHTYSARIEQILNVANVKHRPKCNDVALVVRVNGPEHCQDAWATLRDEKRWTGPKVLLLASTFSNAELGSALAQWNRANVRAVSEEMLFTGQVFIEEIFDQTELAYVHAWNEALPSPEIALDLTIHTSYTDAPILRSNRQSDEFTFSHEQITGNVLVSSTNFVRVMQSWANSRPELTFKV